METIAKNKWKKLLALAKAGEAAAQFELGSYFEHGATDKSGVILTKPSPSKARRWYRLSAKQGDASAQDSLGRLLSSGESGERDYENAIHWAKKAAAQQNSFAFNLGTIYRDQNKPAKALRCYKRATSLTNNEPLFQIALCHLFGFGTKQNFAKAYRHLRKIIAGKPSASSQRAKENALFWMAVIDLTGKSRGKGSIARARKMLETANADGDHEQANEILNIIGKSRYLSA